MGILLFCEYKIYLQYVKKFPQPATVAMIKGRAEHKKLNDKHIKKKVMVKKVIEAIKDSDIPEEEKQAKIKKITKEELNTDREQKVEGERIRGRMDKIKFLSNDVIFITDDKPHDVAYEGDKMQAFGYCMAYQQQHNDALIKKYPTGVSFRAGIYNYKTNTLIWEEDYTHEVEIKLNKLIDRLAGIMDETITAQPTTNYNKCSYCNMRKKCDRQPVNDIDRMLHL